MKSVLTYREQRPNYFDPGDVILEGLGFAWDRVGLDDLFELIVGLLEAL
jgi:hypothetical protein